MHDPATLHVSLELIDAQRELGWPDFHPEDFCHLCGGRNIPWSVNSLIWNAVVRSEDGGTREGMPESEILCPLCFDGEYRKLSEGGVHWDLFLDSPLNGVMTKRVSKWQAAKEARAAAWREAHPHDFD